MTTKHKEITDFEEIRSEKEAAQLLLQMAQTHSPCILWINGETARYHSQSVLRDGQNSILLFALPPDFDRSVIQTTDQKICVQSTLPHTILFFACNFSSIDRTHLGLLPPKKIFRVQRRGGLRHGFKKGKERVALVEGIERRMIDLSASGMAFAVHDFEAVEFKTGRALKEIVFSLEGNEVKVKGIVRHSMAIAGDKQKAWKIGISFDQLPAVADRLISNFIFEENRKLFSHLL